MKVGDKFYDFKDLEISVKKHEEDVLSNYWIKDSKTLEAQRRCFPNGRCSKANDQLKYYYLKYSCIKGGRGCIPKNKIKKTFTFKQGCNASMHIVLSSCGTHLFVKDIVENHNHDLSKEQFEALPHQRLKFKNYHIKECLNLKRNQKFLQDKIRNETGGKKKSHQQLEFSGCMALLRDTYKCFVDVSTDNEGNVKGIFFQDNEMRRSFQTYPEVLFMDGTYCLHDSRASTYFLVVEDAEGKASIAAVGILVNEDAATIDWFLSVFLAQNKEHVKTEVIMTDKDSKERSSLRKFFPDASFNICLFHTLQIFNSEISHKNLNVPNDDCVKAKEILVKLAYSKSENEFDSIYDELRKTAPEAILAYFNKNWLSIREEWVMYSNYSGKSFLNKTNNKLKNLKKHLKAVISKYSQLDEFIKHFFVFLASHRTNKNVERTKQFQKISTTPINRNSPNYSYRQLLADYAFAKVEKELEVFHEVKVLNINSGQQFIAHTVQGFLDVNVSNCKCFFWTSMGLPCRHIFKVRNTLNISLFDESLCLPRWIRKHYITNNPIFNEDTFSFNEKILCESQGGHLSRKRVLTSHEKFKKMNDECLKLAKLCSEVSSSTFYKRLDFIKDLQTKWSNLEEIDNSEDNLLRVDEVCNDVDNVLCDGVVDENCDG